jgi:hypothetical protein
MLASSILAGPLKWVLTILQRLSSPGQFRHVERVLMLGCSTTSAQTLLSIALIVRQRDE